MKKVIVREVYEDQLGEELCFIRHLLRRYPVVSFDTEFPGTLFQPEDRVPYSALSSQSKYALMKKNLDVLKIIQLGLTLSDWNGDLASDGADECYVWQFNFRDFDMDKDLYNSDSIRLLEDQGINFDKNKKEGIKSDYFRRFLLDSGLVNNNGMSSIVSWITFQGSYDFGLLIKILMGGGQHLPGDLESFMGMVRYFFGVKIFDVKHIMKFCGGNGIFGGLEKLAQTLEVPRVAGRSHQAGSDSLLTLQIFFKLVRMFFVDANGKPSIPGMSILHGFEQFQSMPPAVATRGLFPPVQAQQQPFMVLQPPPQPVLVRRVYPGLHPVMFPCGGRVIQVVGPFMFPRPRLGMMCNPTITMAS